MYVCIYTFGCMFLHFLVLLRLAECDLSNLFAAKLLYSYTIAKTQILSENTIYRRIRHIDVIKLLFRALEFQKQNVSRLFLVTRLVVLVPRKCESDSSSIEPQ